MKLIDFDVVVGELKELLRLANEDGNLTLVTMVELMIAILHRQPIIQMKLIDFDVVVGELKELLRLANEDGNITLVTMVELMIAILHRQPIIQVDGKEDHA